jgi:hypothetical protein
MRRSKKKPTTKEAIGKLRLFNEKAQLLRESRFVQMVFTEGSGVTVSYRQGQPLRVVRRGADREALAAFALTFRFFLQKNDGISLKQIERLYHSLDVPEDDRCLVTENWKNLNGFLDSAPELAPNGQAITFRNVLETFIYGNLSHVNPGKEEVYKAWRAGPFALVLEGYFEHVLAEVLKFILWLASMNAETIQRLENQPA